MIIPGKGDKNRQILYDITSRCDLKMDTDELIGTIAVWGQQHGIDNPDKQTIKLMEEVGELARIMARKYGDQSFKEGEKADLGEEMADVLWVLICLANQTGIDLTEELQKSIEKKTKRDRERHRNNSKL